MRLVDMACQAPAWVGASGVGDARGLAAAGSLAPAIASTSLRYILDRPASETCRSLVFRPDGPLADVDDLPRLPGRPFWLETYVGGGAPVGAGSPVLLRLGLLLDVAEDGRSGSIDCVFEPSAGEIHRLPARLEFDLRCEAANGRPGFHRMRHPGEPHVDRLLARASLVVDRHYADRARACGTPYSGAVSGLAEVAWCALPVALSFAALLDARGALVHRPSSLGRLNVARAATGRPALLEHVEVGLNLTPRTTGAGRAAAIAEARQAPCLHFVRGHSVTRAGNTFWRSSHLRGTGPAEPTRTVRVTAGRPGGDRGSGSRAAQERDRRVDA